MFLSRNDKSVQSIPASISIVGGGASGVAALIKIIDHAIEAKKTHFSIHMFEKYDSAGPGLPYREDQDYRLKVNDPSDEMIIDIDNPKDFLNWLKKNKEKLKKEHPTISDSIENAANEINKFPPRALFGEYLRDKISEYVNKAKEHNIDVVIHANTEIVHAAPIEDHHWRLTAKIGQSGNQIFLADQLILATGHLPSHNINETFYLRPNFFRSSILNRDNKKIVSIVKWNNKTHQLEPGRLNSDFAYYNVSLSKTPAKLDSNAAIAILGTSLSGIDQARLLAEHKGPVYLISGSGQLPTLKRLYSPSYELKFLSREKLAKYKKLTLADLQDLLTKELRNATKIENLTWDKIEEIAMRHDQDPVKVLHQEIDEVIHRDPRMWQSAINETFFNSLPLIWKLLDQNERALFWHKVMPVYNKWIAGMPLENAKELAQLLDRDQLKIIKVNDSNKHIHFNPITGGYTIDTTEGKKIQVDYVIDATGTGHYWADSPLLRNMVINGFVKTGNIGTTSTILASDDFHLMNGNGKPYANAYGIGQAIQGSQIIGFAVETCARNAAIIAPQVVENLDKVYSLKSSL